MTPDGALAPTGTLPSGSDDLARGVREDHKLPLERRLDCFAGACRPIATPATASRAAVREIAAEGLPRGAQYPRRGSAMLMSGCPATNRL
jgi:hypothetical protein